jgi:hypothetical protein
VRESRCGEAEVLVYLDCRILGLYAHGIQEFPSWDHYADRDPCESLASAEGGPTRRTINAKITRFSTACHQGGAVELIGI